MDMPHGMSSVGLDMAMSSVLLDIEQVTGHATGQGNWTFKQCNIITLYNMYSMQ